MGCARVRKVGKAGERDRIARLMQYKGGGFGGLIVGRLFDHCVKKGVAGIFLYSQVYAKGFYEKLGFVSRGGVFKDGGIDHVEMLLEPPVPSDIDTPCRNQ